MSTEVSPTRPRRTRKEVEAQIKKAGIEWPVVVVGCRGYYRRTAAENQRGVYDDAVFVVTPDTFAAFNFNVDPSVYRQNIANLNLGVWWYKIGIHGLSKPKEQQYRAFVQAAPVTVQRDGNGHDSGWFGINIHRGGVNSTSSLGCQTVPPKQWDAVFALVESEMKRNKVTKFAYLLVDY